MFYLRQLNTATIFVKLTVNDTSRAVGVAWGVQRLIQARSANKRREISAQVYGPITIRKPLATAWSALSDWWKFYVGGRERRPSSHWEENEEVSEIWGGEKWARLSFEQCYFTVVLHVQHHGWVSFKIRGYTLVQSKNESVCDDLCVVFVECRICLFFSAWIFGVDSLVFWASSVQANLL